VDLVAQPEAAAATRRVTAASSANLDEWLQRGLLGLLFGWLLLAVVLPLGTLFRKALEDHDGAFIGLSNFAAYFAEPALVRSLTNTVVIAGISPIITLLLGFGFAYAVTRSAMPGRAIFRQVAMVPLLAPSLLPGLRLAAARGTEKADEFPGMNVQRHILQG